jgi:phage/plasmid-associated DNA primase
VRQVWERVLGRLNCNEIDLTHDENESLLNWWIRRTSQGGKDKAKAKKSIHMLVAWEIWCERNRRVFRNQEKTLQQLLDKIHDEVKLWRICGATNIARLSA